MKGIVVYDTSYGNTKKISETIAETLKQSELDVDIFKVSDAKLGAKDYDFLILGSPTNRNNGLCGQILLGKGLNTLHNNL